MSGFLIVETVSEVALPTAVRDAFADAIASAPAADDGRVLARVQRLDLDAADAMRPTWLLALGGGPVLAGDVVDSADGRGECGTVVTLADGTVRTDDEFHIVERVRVV